MSEVIAIIRIGLSPGFTLRQVGRLGMAAGKREEAVLIAACTSWTALSMPFSSSNCSVICVVPNALEEVIWRTPGTELNCTSSGVATDEAMVSALAPGRVALICSVGKSAAGSGATASCGNANAPSNINAMASKVVPTGCAMHQPGSHARRS